MIYDFSAEIQLGASNMKDARKALAKHYNIDIELAKRIFCVVRKIKID